MMVKSFKVSLGYTDGRSIDITDTVLNVNIVESLFGNIEGNIEIVDGIGMLDSAITNQNNIRIEFDYLSHKVTHDFYVDGVNSVDVTTHLNKKTYVINLKSLNDLANSMQLVAKSFKGRSSDIIKTIFDSAFDTKLEVLDKSITEGHYIAPNVSPNIAISQIQKQAYDINHNPFFLFQRFVNNNRTFLTSLTQIENQEATNTISTQIQDSETISKTLGNIGQPSNIVIHSDNDNQINKVARGIYGKTVVNLDVANSSVSPEKYGAATEAVSKINIMRLDMFGDNSRPLLNTNDHVNICKMQSVLNLLFDTRVTAYGCQAIPNIGVGNKVELKIIKNKQKKSVSNKFSGNYIISNIIHRIEDGDYTQVIEMIRG